VPEAQMFSTKIYPLALVEKKQLDKFLNEKLKSQQICPLKPLMASPTGISHFFFIKKKDETFTLFMTTGSST